MVERRQLESYFKKSKCYPRTYLELSTPVEKEMLDYWFCNVGFFNAAVAINIKSFPSFPSGSFSMFSLIFFSHWTVIYMTVLLFFVDLKVLCNDCKSNRENFAMKLSVGTFLTTMNKRVRHDHLAKKLIHLIEVSCQENRLYCHLKCLYLFYFFVTDSPLFIAL